jgi:hypothetical protein
MFSRIGIAAVLAGSLLAGDRGTAAICWRGITATADAGCGPVGGRQVGERDGAWVPVNASATGLRTSRQGIKLAVAALLPALLAAACSATTGQRTVFPDSTGTSNRMPMSRDEITDVGFEPFYNVTGDPIRLRSVSFVSPPDALRVLNVRAYNYKHTRDVPVGAAGDLAKECPDLFKPKPTNSYITPPHGASSWFVVIAFTISKPGRYYLKKVRVDYTAGGHPGWQYIAIDTTMVITNPPDPGPRPEPPSAVCG